jgi:hypothetical protein
MIFRACVEGASKAAHALHRQSYTAAEAKRDGRRRAVAFPEFSKVWIPAMTRATRRAAIVACLALLGGAAYWHWGPSRPQQPQAKQQNRTAAGFRRGGGNPNDTVPVLAVEAQLADVPVYLDGVGTRRSTPSRCSRRSTAS